MTESEQKYKTSLSQEDLTVLNGIGPSAVEKLNQANIFTIKDLSITTAHHLSKIKGIGKKTAENFIQQAKEYLGIDDVEKKKEVGEMKEIEEKEIEIDLESVGDRINSQEIEPKGNNHQSKSNAIFTIPTAVSQLNKSNNKYSSKSKKQIPQKKEELEKSKIQDKQSQKKKITNSGKKTDLLKKAKIKVKTNPKNLEKIKSFNYAMFSSKGYTASEVYKKEVNTLATRLLYLAIPTFIFGAIFIILLNALPLNTLYLLSTFGSLILTSFLFGVGILFTTFYKHKLNIPKNSIIENEVLNTTVEVESDTQISENELGEEEITPKTQLGSSEFIQYLDDVQEESPFEEKYQNRYPL